MTTYIPAALRQLVEKRAQRRCEYCLIRDEVSYWSHQIDHIFAEKHGGETIEYNLCYCCVICSRSKGSDLASLDPRTGEPEFLFHPRRNKWNEHFRLDGALIVPLTPQAHATVRLLRLNDKERVDERAELIALDLYP